ncbi:hypothetical protein C0585_06515 [Candidatus Woesearchaeota archaeon]|nr:MAG: hypothetical protein C0585_06515 [Candidatus Woesearchaeota archaeon]
MGTLLFIIILLIGLAISALPLNIAVHLLGGDSSTIKVIIVNISVGIVAALINVYVNVYAGIVAFIAMLFIYKVAFDLGWIRAFFAWILQGIILALLILGLILVFGAGVLTTLL